MTSQNWPNYKWVLWGCFSLQLKWHSLEIWIVKTNNFQHVPPRLTAHKQALVDNIDAWAMWISPLSLFYSILCTGYHTGMLRFLLGKTSKMVFRMPKNNCNKVMKIKVTKYMSRTKTKASIMSVMYITMQNWKQCVTNIRIYLNIRIFLCEYVIFEYEYLISWIRIYSYIRIFVGEYSNIETFEYDQIF